MEFREQFPTMTNHPAWDTLSGHPARGAGNEVIGNRQLEHVGLSREQMAGLERVKALYQQGAYHEATPEHKRQAFVRWLYLQGRLQS